MSPGPAPSLRRPPVSDSSTKVSDLTSDRVDRIESSPILREDGTPERSGGPGDPTETSTGVTPTRNWSQRV